MIDGNTDQNRLIRFRIHTSDCFCQQNGQEHIGTSVTVLTDLHHFLFRNLQEDIFPFFQLIRQFGMDVVKVGSNFFLIKSLRYGIQIQ